MIMTGKSMFHICIEIGTLGPWNLNIAISVQSKGDWIYDNDEEKYVSYL